MSRGGNAAQDQGENGESVRPLGFTLSPFSPFGQQSFSRLVALLSCSEPDEHDRVKVGKAAAWQRGVQNPVIRCATDFQRHVNDVVRVQGKQDKQRCRFFAVVF